MIELLAESFQGNATMRTHQNRPGRSRGPRLPTPSPASRNPGTHRATKSTRSRILLGQCQFFALQNEITAPRHGMELAPIWKIVMDVEAERQGNAERGLEMESAMVLVEASLARHDRARQT